MNESGTIAILKQVENPDVYKNIQKLSIKGIPAVYDVFEEGGKSYVIEEYISGKTLSEKISADGKLSSAEVRRIVCELCLTLIPLHANDIIHRDIKPSNIMITPTGRVYLIDFDIARKRSDNSTDTTHLGTQYYASPEQYGFAQTDSRSDIYSLGRLMLVLLSGKEAEIQGNTPYKHIIQKCTQVDANKRYKSTAQLYAVLKFSVLLKTGAAVAAVIAAGVVVILIAGSGHKKDIVKNDGDIVSKDEKKIEENTEDFGIDDAQNITDDTEEGETEAVEAESGEAEGENTTLKEEKEGRSQTVEKESEQTTANTVTETEKSEPTTVTRIKKETQEPTVIKTTLLDENKSANENTDGYLEDTLWLDFDKTTGHNIFDNIFIRSPETDTPLMDLDSDYPKQVNSIEMKSGVSERVYAEITSEGLKITTSGGSLTVPKSPNIEHYPNEDLVADSHSFSMIFKDFNSDGTKEILVVDLACCSLGNKKLKPLFMTGKFIIFDDKMKPSFCSGDDLYTMSGSDLVIINNNTNSVLTQNSYGVQFISYRMRGSTVEKYTGIE